MPLKPRFLHTDISELRISRQRLLGGIIIGLLYAFALYGVLYMSREMIRMMSVTENFDLWVMTDAEVNFYNLAFAFIAVILGFSTGFLFCVERPRNAFGQVRYRRFSIVNDLRALNWYFLSAYSKLAWGLGAVYASFYCYRGFFYSHNPYDNFMEDNDLFPIYKLVYILIIIVLFLQMWTTIRQVFKNKSLKWMLISMLGLIVVGFGLSRVNLIDYEAVNASILKNNTHYTYKIELPDVTHFRTDYFIKGLGRINDIYFAPNQNKKDSAPMMFFEGKEMSFKEIGERIKTRSEYWRHQEELRLHFHRTIKMKHVWKVYEEMGKEAFTKFSFAVVRIRHENDKRYYHDYSFPTQVPIQFWDSPLLPPVTILHEDLKKMDDIEIRHAVSGHLVDGILLKKEAFKQIVSERIRKSSPKYVIKFHIKDDANVESYIKTLSLIKETMQGIRDEYAMQKYAQKEKSLDYEQRKEIRKKYPLAIFQITEEMEAKYE